MLGTIPRTVYAPILVAPGVEAEIHDTPNGLYIPLVHAVRPGRGDVSRWLDSLPADRRIVFPCVISARLRGMLERRGYVKRWEWYPHNREWVDCYVQEPRP